MSLPLVYIVVLVLFVLLVSAFRLSRRTKIYAPEILQRPAPRNNTNTNTDTNTNTESAPLTLTREQLRNYRGENGAPMYIALKGKIYDLSSNATARELYGPSSKYNRLVGTDASRALATMNLDETKFSLDGLTAEQLKTLNEWVARYEQKYRVVGHVVD
eukprot:TRINITY_DN16442_c0_g1_i7.p1 TRINITY_DN16442_c0_g1~~TRINITY_DN16442_c0_g1_i7.p1  ORF type:complete len:159 (-),score=23.26 TRINITY_DN16442_c0_g1_i7:123-599(-)